MNLLVVLVSLFGLWWGTEIAVKAALRIAESRGLSQAFVGMTILAIGTDFPEMVMAIVAAVGRLQGVEASGLILGSAIGSCMGQIAMVLGVAGLYGYLSISPSRVKLDGLMIMGSILVFTLVCLDGEVSRIDGAILLACYAICFLSLIQREQDDGTEPPAAAAASSWVKDLSICAAGLFLVTVCSHTCIEFALRLADEWGMGQTVVGVMLVGLGTSLPELALSIGAIKNKAGALSVGNIFGSNVFDMLVPTGMAAVISGIDARVAGLLTFDIPALAAVSLITLVFFRRKRGLQTFEAGILLSLYTAYVAARVFLV